ncbi:DNA-binding transcriptional response regulator [Myroides guanonis]|uniref:DNA-binding response regulator, NarL/FixJ family, contains REC and HTH domains n=1 Tax=Myroides guanonis TaxID=1150112 RepID=A0A1I3T536_9FLAO|nr:response regulator transcription factor [Myroides guanonis]SFJ65339.1 DNA-binding response regulator, NarL/FixJ family, contains REC and HTH domains [Myroides guanonis]
MNILVVDDHPLTVEGYIFSLTQHLKKEGTLLFHRANDCESAFLQIRNALESNKPFDLAIVDYGLPEYEARDWKNGGHIISYIKEMMPDCKTMILTAHTEVLLVYNIIKNVRPHGLAIKNDVTPSNLPDMICEILDGNYFLSPLVKQCHGEVLKKELMFDDNNRLILLYLSKGYRMSDLEEHIPLAAITIRKRIAKMKATFGVSDASALIQEAFKQGFV